MEIPGQLIERLKKSRHTVVSTGAGTSAESGIPTFRDAQTGLWARFRPEDLATPEAFERQPEVVWDWYQHRRLMVRAATPNPGHLALAELAGLIRRLTLITQNVDGLHQRAGSQQVIELHGNILVNRCHRTGQVITDEQLIASDESPPRSPHHPQGLARPGVVWFGEALPGEALEQAFASLMECDLFFSIGTSTQVEPAASLPFMARERGALVVEVNPDETPLTPVADFSLCGPSGEVLPAIIAALR
jgi:NAD-dependent deacetylase